MPEVILTPDADDPYPSVRVSASGHLYVWDPALNSLRNVTVEAPVAEAMPWAVEVFEGGASRGCLRASALPLLRAALRGLTVAALARRDGAPLLQVRCSYSTGGTVAWADPSLPDPVTGTWLRWPRDWNGLLNAELAVRLGLGDMV